MIFGNGSLGWQVDNTGAAATVTAANNGVSLNGTTVVLGDNAGGILSTLLNNREIEFGNFILSFLNTPLGLVSQMFGGAIIFIDNVNGLQGTIQSTSAQFNSNVFGGVATIQAADPIASASSFLSLVGPNPDSSVNLGTSFRVFEDLDGMIIQNAGQSSNFFFDITNNELRIFNVPSTQAGAVLAGKAISSPAAVNPINLVFPNDHGRVISDYGNVAAVAIVINVPAGVPGAYFDVAISPDAGAAVPSITINLNSANDIPGQFPGLIGTAAGGWTAPILQGGEYVRFFCGAAGNGVATNWQILVMDGLSGGAWAPF
jgi:hypothetical protein